MKRKEADLKNPICEECHRVWQEYARATADHLTLDSKLRLAALSRNYEVIRALTHEVENAEEERMWTREEIRKHEATHPIADAPGSFENYPLSDISN